MATSVQSLGPVDQFQQLFSSIGSFFSSLCESTDSAFRRVHVMKRGEDGNIKFYDVKDKVTGEVKRTPLVTYIEDVRTGEMYLDEEAWIVSIKCALVALGMPFYTVGKMTWHAFKTPIEIAAVASNILVEAGRNFSQCRFYEGFANLRNACIVLPEVFGNGLYEIVKAPIFGFWAILTGLYGIPKPYHGRKIEAIIERAWENGISFKDDFRNIPPREGEGCLEAFAKDIMQTRPFYLAYCFQVRDNTRDPRIVVIRRE
jgi:hypothetical protein